MKCWKSILMTLMLAGVVVLPTGCDSEEEENKESHDKAVGTYRLEYNWDNSGEGYIPTITLAADGTWTDGTYTGRWFNDGDTVVFSYPHVKYEGVLVIAGISGSMIDFNTGETGTFTMVRLG